MQLIGGRFVVHYGCNGVLAYLYLQRKPAYQTHIEYRKGKIIAASEQAVRDNPQDAAAYYKRGVAYARIDGEYGKAIADLDRAIALNPNYARLQR